MDIGYLTKVVPFLATIFILGNAAHATKKYQPLDVERYLAEKEAYHRSGRLRRARILTAAKGRLSYQ